MPERDLLVLVFAPATVGLVVMACRRFSLPVYLAGLVAVLGLVLLGLSPTPLGVETTLINHLVVAAVFIVAPTLAAFAAGRLIATHHGGAYVFAASCTAYLFGLGLAAAIMSLSSRIVP
jgi:hypothetical protein